MFSSSGQPEQPIDSFPPSQLHDAIKYERHERVDFFSVRQESPKGKSYVSADKNAKGHLVFEHSRANRANEFLGLVNFTELGKRLTLYLLLCRKR